MGFIDKPKQLWWRKAIFQIHLWVGIALCLYIAVIGFTGSILVMRSELERVIFRKALVNLEPVSSSLTPLDQMIRTVQKAHPSATISIAYLPKHDDENALIMASVKGEATARYVFVSPSSGQVAGEINTSRNWLFYVGQIHYFLLLGRSGLVVNGVGASFLLLLTLSGLILWWPGVRNWKRGLGVKVDANWKRVNFDLHSSIGFWTLAIVSIWSVSSIYFAWPKQITGLVGKVSSVATFVQPRVVVSPPLAGEKMLPLGGLIESGKAASSQAHLYGLFLPRGPRAPLTVLMARAEPGDFNNMDYVFVDPYRGNTLSIWHRGINPTWGSKLLFWLGPLHFGTHWGLGIKIVWFLIGLSLPTLAITGVLMYWNRFLRSRWKRLGELKRN
jgi:uncharacterized iron-regulated membrane protein